MHDPECQGTGAVEVPKAMPAADSEAGSWSVTYWLRDNWQVLMLTILPSDKQGRQGEKDRPYE